MEILWMVLGVLWCIGEGLIWFGKVAAVPIMVIGLIG